MRKATFGLAIVLAVAGCGAQEGGPSSQPNAAPSPTSPSATLAAADVEQLVGHWRATPIALGDDAVRQIDAECQAFSLFAPSVSLVVVDARGQGRIILQYAGEDGHDGVCEATVQADGSFMTQPVSHTIHPQVIEVEPIEDDELRVRGGFGSPGSAAPADRWRSVAGQAGSGIEQVVAEVPGQADAVVASTGDGWFVLWWPAPAAGQYRLVGLNDAGEEVAALSEP